MSNGFFNFGRPKRQDEPRASDERSPDVAGTQSRAPEQAATERRDPGVDALLELARLIGQPDPTTQVPGRSDEALRPASALDRVVPSRRDSDFAQPRATVQPAHPGADHSETRHAPDSFDFLQLPGRHDYPVAPQQASADEDDYHHGGGRDGSRTGGRYPAYGTPHDEEGYADEYRDGEYGQDVHHEEYGQDIDHEYEAESEELAESGAKPRRSRKVVLAVLGLAVFGSAAAFGYRAIFKAPPSGPTPIIRANNSPTKVAADANARPANAGLGSGSGEQLVRRDEDPVDVGSSYRPGLMDASGRLPPDSAGSPPEAVPPLMRPTLQSDPRRVQTVRISPNPDTPSPDRTPSRAALPPQSQPLPRQAAVAPPQSQPPRQATAAPPPAYAAPVAVAPEAAAPRAVEAGGFVVQVSAQRSEAEAQSAFRTLQTKYSALSGREPLIRRKDLGEKGIFFAAQVGPFGVKGDADQLCETLKAAGGACFVQKN